MREIYLFSGRQGGSARGRSERPHGAATDEMGGTEISSKLMVDAATDPSMSTRAGRGLPRGEVDAETECRVRFECVSVTVCIP